MPSSRFPLRVPVGVRAVAFLFVMTAATLSAQPGAAPAKTKGAPPPPRVPAGVVAHRDLAYVAGGHERQKLDLYLPEKSAGPLPVIVWVHGGGWQGGSKNQCRPLADGFVARGYAVASIGYRLSGDAIFPAQLEDCKAAVRWLRARARDYGLDPARFAAWGSSAGGHLVALLGTTGDVPDFDVGAHRDQPSRVQAVVDWFGPTDFNAMDRHAPPGAGLKHDAPNSPESKLIGAPIADPAHRAKVRRADPITYVSAGDPPFLIMHGDADGTVPHHQSVLLYDALAAAGVPVRFVTLAGAGHGTGGFGAPAAAELVASFLDHRLKGADTAAARWPAASRATLPAAAPR